MANIFQAIEKSAIGFKSEDDIKGLFDNLDTRSNILGGTVPEKINAYLISLTVSIALTLAILRKMTLMLGDAYEFLISNHASNAGKSGVNFHATDGFLNY